MAKILKSFVFIALITLIGCSNGVNNNEVENDEVTNNDNRTISHYFTGTIGDINDNQAIVSQTGGGNVLVDLSVNSDVTFQVGDKVKVGYNGTMMESDPAIINTHYVELID